MNPESITVSLETAKKLKETGFNKETVFAWVNRNFKDEPKRFVLEFLDKVSPINKIYPAPTSGEIELPRDYGCFNFIEKFVCGELDFTLMGYETIEWIEDSKADSEVEAKCKAWLWLKEEGLI